jgi:hypothetical protein
VVGWLVVWVRGCKSGTKGMIQLNNKYSTAYAIFILFFPPHRVPSLSLESNDTMTKNFTKNI